MLFDAETHTGLISSWPDADTIDNQVSHKLNTLCIHAARDERSLNPFILDQEQGDGFGARHSSTGIGKYGIP